MGSAVLQFQAPIPEVTSDSLMYSPPSFPPPSDFTVSLTSDGKPLSAYGDNYWDFSGWKEDRKFNFGRQKLSKGNLDLVKQATFFVMYHPQLFPGSIGSVYQYFKILVKVAKVCDAKNLLIKDLHGFPRMFPLIADALSRDSVLIPRLHKLNLWSDELGFPIGGERLLTLLRKQIKKREIVQHAYIPPRIWKYQVQRFTEVLEDFSQHQDAIADAFEWLVKAHEHNRKAGLPSVYSSPFSNQRSYRSKRIIYDGDFRDFLVNYGLSDVFRRWIPLSGKSASFSAYLTMVRNVSVLYILNFSLQRLSEARSLRADCFRVERDQKLGNVCYIVGETKKTVKDDTARWVVPETVKMAVDAASEVARLRVSALPDTLPISKEDSENPYLLFPVTDPWTVGMAKIQADAHIHGHVRSERLLNYSEINRWGRKIFDDDVIRITEEDARLARSLTPNIDEKQWFGVGKPWHFSAHQLRRTLAVNMFASDIVSTSALQHQMKHFSRVMTLYYGRHHANLRLNSGAQNTMILESYDSTYRTLVGIVEDDDENVKPHGRIPSFDSIADLIEAKEEEKLKTMIRKGLVGVRQTLLGYCMKPGPCEYGGFESISKCAGGDGGGICADAIFSREKMDKLLRLREAHQKQLEQEPRDSMRAGALEEEIDAIGRYEDVLARQG